MFSLCPAARPSFAFVVRLLRPCCFAGFVCVAGLSRAASFDDRIGALFRPPLGEMMALSPDGQQIAYTQVARDTRIVMMNLDLPGPKRTVKVSPDRDATLPEDPPPVELRFL